MSTDLIRLGNEQRVALAVYQFGETVTFSRLSAERAYLHGSNDGDWRIDPQPPVPETVARNLGLLLECAAAVEAVVPGAAELPSQVAALGESARGMRSPLRAGWSTADHQNRLARRRERLDRSEEPDAYREDFAALAGSPLAPSCWAGYLQAADGVGAALPSGLRELFELGWSLAAAAFPLPSDWDPDNGVPRSLDPVCLLTVLGPRVANLIRAARARFGVLSGVPDRLDGSDPCTPAARLADAIRTALSAQPNPSDHASGGVTPTPLPDAPTTASISAPTIVPLGPNENLSELIALNEQLDPEGIYVGQSLQVLRLFRHINEPNRLPDDPIVILGPSGAGKTSLARLIHRASSRGARPFLDLSADDVSSGDATLRRVKWAGHGRNAGLHGVPPGTTAPGWLGAAAGGTIFVDELHDLDGETAGLLRKVLERREIPLATGQSLPVRPDVRLIFATYRNVEHLAEVLPADFLRRLRGRHLVIPPLRERKEDIPLFVERWRDGRRPSESFLLALLRHDWGRARWTR